MKFNHDNQANQRDVNPTTQAELRVNQGHQAVFCTEAQVNGYAEHLASVLSYRCEAE
ncbi:MAG: hypothetical protein AAGF24_02805 [Cyanobacteria bacterium P01_H01_bin.121]